MPSLCIGRFREWGLFMDNSTLQPFLERLSSMSIDTLIRTALVALVGYVLVRVVVALIRRALNRTSLDHAISRSLVALCRLILYFILFTICMGQLGISSTSLVTLLGVFGLALSLALQDTLSNIAGGLFVLTTKPYKVGDYVEACGMEGTVQYIGFIHTILTTIDNKTIYLPNGPVSKDEIVNYSTQGRRQLELNIGIGYEDDSAAARALIAQVVQADPRVEKGAPPFVKVWELGPSAVQIKVRAWTSAADMIDARCDLYEAVKTALQQNGFHIPYPQAQVHLTKLQ